MAVEVEGVETVDKSEKLSLAVGEKSSSKADVGREALLSGGSKAETTVELRIDGGVR